MKKTESNHHKLKDMLVTILKKYPAAKTSPYPGPDKEMFNLVQRDLPALLRTKLNKLGISNWECLGSIGKGQWALVPWVAILNPEITQAVSEGIYVVYLFCSDGSGVYLTLNQGTGGISSASTNNP